MTVDPKTISAMSRDLHGTTLTDTRAAELAAEVGRINEHVTREAAGRLDFFDDPVHFLAVLERLADPDEEVAK